MQAGEWADTAANGADADAGRRRDVGRFDDTPGQMRIRPGGLRRRRKRGRGGCLSAPALSLPGGSFYEGPFSGDAFPGGYRSSIGTYSRSIGPT